MFLINFAPSVGFGTSGVRALVSDLTAPVVATYVRVFIQHLRQTGQLQAATTHCVVGWDLRPSSPDIAAAVCAGLQQESLLPDWAGCLPTPALALRALQTGCPGIMVTGSHIPFDRNGIKFYTAQGEILKADEAAMAVIPVASLAPVNGMVPRLAECIVQVKAQLGDSAALTAYTQRYIQLLPAQAFQGLRIGVYQHSAVGRDMLAQLLAQLGALALKFGDRELAAYALCTLGVTLGFLVWNYPRGLIFAGDGGAYFWGLNIAVISIMLVQRHPQVSPWFPMLLLMYPVWETVFSIYRKLARGVAPGVADSMHLHHVIYKRLVRAVFDTDEAKMLLSRNNRTTPYLLALMLFTVVPAMIFWSNTPVLIGFCALFAVSYVIFYLVLIKFKVPRWLRQMRR